MEACFMTSMLARSKAYHEEEEKLRLEEALEEDGAGRRKNERQKRKRKAEMEATDKEMEAMFAVAGTVLALYHSKERATRSANHTRDKRWWENSYRVWDDHMLSPGGHSTHNCTIDVRTKKPGIGSIIKTQKSTRSRI